MKYTELVGDLFEYDGYIAHCISSDIAMGRGIAVKVENIHRVKGKLLEKTVDDRKHPTCILEGKVLNLITKEKYWHKPTYQDLSKSLMRMKQLVETENISKIHMPTIGSGLDKLSWHRVSKIIQEVFKDTDIEIIVVKR